MHWRPMKLLLHYYYGSQLKYSTTAKNRGLERGWACIWGQLNYTLLLLKPSQNEPKGEPQCADEGFGGAAGVGHALGAN